MVDEQPKTMPEDTSMADKPPRGGFPPYLRSCMALVDTHERACACAMGGFTIALTSIACVGPFGEYADLDGDCCFYCLDHATTNFSQRLVVEVDGSPVEVWWWSNTEDKPCYVCGAEWSGGKAYREYREVSEDRNPDTIAICRACAGLE